jgi:hypothetical protein
MGHIKKQKTLSCLSTALIGFIIEVGGGFEPP